MNSKMLTRMIVYAEEAGKMDSLPGSLPALVFNHGDFVIKVVKEMMLLISEKINQVMPSSMAFTPETNQTVFIYALNDVFNIVCQTQDSNRALSPVVLMQDVYALAPSALFYHATGEHRVITQKIQEHSISAERTNDFFQKRQYAENYMGISPEKRLHNSSQLQAWNAEKQQKALARAKNARKHEPFTSE